MADVEVYIDLDGRPRPVGLLRRHASRRDETVTFEYDETWLADDERFSIEPALALTRGVFPPPADQPMLRVNQDENRIDSGFLLPGEGRCLM
jgi:serine/threonine-protein kinase HipA